MQQTSVSASDSQIFPDIPSLPALKGATFDRPRRPWWPALLPADDGARDINGAADGRTAASSQAVGSAPSPGIGT
jgi:hypothetical protein